MSTVMYFSSILVPKRHMIIANTFKLHLFCSNPLIYMYYFAIQMTAVIRRSIIVRYYINNYRNWGRISIRCWIHKRHPMPRPNGVSFVNICEKIDRVITVPHCISLCFTLPRNSCKCSLSICVACSSGALISWDNVRFLLIVGSVSMSTGGVGGTPCCSIR